jgi:hypothetical protein
LEKGDLHISTEREARGGQAALPYRLPRERGSAYFDRTRGARWPDGATLPGCFRDNMNRPKDLIHDR